ncbi:hypothetical protein ACOSZF_12040 [Cytobacillus firmus]|nr:hypothetical protein [Cytobacillus firmus]MEC1892251.1 hypothetical protein [Cytobacillus firmus]MED1908283.1 hypothetical protein [Cytobacillus firmus]MED4447878.1 hypothetical protein [Cytobacillus firmus]MED4767301.1 hypothetical protein [Cytobacillus firmus]SUV05416.1 Uncharacterised protein [Cytobacillus firmus]
MMEKLRTYTDYANKTALTIPDHFIDVKTGNSVKVSQKIQEQVDYHSNNNTLIHLVLSALNSYLHPKNMNSDIILSEIHEIKKMMQSGYAAGQTPAYKETVFHGSKQDEVDLKEVEDVLEAFGG